MNEAAAENAAPLVIATNLDDVQNERLARHPRGPRIVPYSLDRPAWEIPATADVVFTYYRGWAGAPSEPPPGWPFRLRWIQIAAAGIDAFPDWFFTGPPVTSGRGVGAIAIAEYALAAMLAHEKQIFDGIRVTGAAMWKPRMLGRLHGKTLGLVGLGAIGREVARRAASFGMTVLATTRSGGGQAGVTIVRSVAELAARSDHLVVAAPLTRETRGIIGAEILSQARPGLHIVNVSRGALVDQDALLVALDHGQIGAATLDVTTPEPLPEGDPLYRHPCVRLTPHSAWCTDDAVDRLTAKLFDNLDRFLAGRELLDVVDAQRGY
ncbi:NAD(P)-dependent oxidoreductase [Xanthobacteraceae bacterium Astr-EGSB]|uniref:NAD(P)-dependent oxidoreductase n=1 Tax=Astrobacterium formosum TaxID=3069710 RepID=UPI0027B4CE39|nr:NAD(P)-dependent oxidoreductase [Xanthobacteraceae bacterium Astr-EGSB]